MYLCFTVHVTISSLCLHTEGSWSRVCLCSLPFPVHLFPVKDIRHDSPEVCSPLSPQKVQFWQQEAGTSLDTVSAVYFNQQCLEKFPGTTSKSQEWAILRLNHQSRFSLSESSFWELPRKPIKINRVHPFGWNTSGTMSLFIYGPLENNPMENKQGIATGTDWIWNAIKVSGFLSREPVSKAQQPSLRAGSQSWGRERVTQGTINVTKICWALCSPEGFY